MNPDVGAPVSDPARSDRSRVSCRAGGQRFGSWVAATVFCPRLRTMNRTARRPGAQRLRWSEQIGKNNVLSPYAAAATGDRSRSGSWVASTVCCPRIGTMNPDIGAPVSDPARPDRSRVSCRVGDRRSGSWVARPRSTVFGDQDSISILSSSGRSFALLAHC